MAGKNNSHVHYRGQIIESAVAKLGIERVLGHDVISVVQRDDRTLAYSTIGKPYGEILIADILPKSSVNCLFVGVEVYEPQEAYEQQECQKTA